MKIPTVSLVSLSLIVILLNLVAQTTALECYACTVCRQPFSKKYTDTKTGCKVCSVAQSWADGKRVTTTRGCDNVCVPADARIQGYGVVKACCKTDLCNGKSNLKWIKSVALIGILSAMSLNYF